MKFILIKSLYVQKKTKSKFLIFLRPVFVLFFLLFFSANCNKYLNSIAKRLPYAKRKEMNKRMKTKSKTKNGN